MTVPRSGAALAAGRCIAILVVLVAAVSASAPSAFARLRQVSASCSESAAHAQLLAHNLGQSGLVGQLVCADFTGDGRIDMAVAEGTPGSAGVIGFAIFVASGAGWTIGLSDSNAYRPTLVRLGEELLVYVPVYRKGDPNCCPTGGTADTLYRFEDGRFRAAYAWHQE